MIIDIGNNQPKYNAFVLSEHLQPPASIYSTVLLSTSQSIFTRPCSITDGLAISLVYRARPDISKITKN